MPFESFLNKTNRKRGVLFHATIAFSLFAHAGALAWATVRSITDVEELPAPQVKLTFIRAPLLAAAPPKAPAAAKSSEPSARPAAKRQERAKPVLAQPLLSTPPLEKPHEQPQPPVEEPKAVEASAEMKEAAVGAGNGKSGRDGVGAPGVGGTASGSHSGPAVPNGALAMPPRKILPEALGKLQRLSGAAPFFPAQLAKDDSLFVVMTKVCVSAAGTVDAVDIMKRADPLLDKNVVDAVRGWRYKPLISGETAVPFCTFVRFEFRTR